LPIYEPGLGRDYHRNGLGASAAFHRQHSGGSKTTHKSSSSLFLLRSSQMGMSISVSWKKLRAEIAGVLTDYRLIVDKAGP